MSSNEALNSYYSDIMGFLMYSKKETLKFGFMNSIGEVIIDPEFDFASDFNGDVANIKKDNVSGIVNKIGESKFFENYDSTFWVKDDIGIAFKNYKAGFINKKGNVIIPLIYDEVNPFSDGYASVKLNDRWFYINKEGLKILPDSLQYNYSPMVDSKAIFMWKDSISSKKNRFNSTIIQMIEYLDKEVKIPLKEGLISSDGKILLEPHFDEISGYFVKNFMRVRNNKKEGVIGIEGEVIIPLNYQEISDFSEGLFCAKNNNKWGFVDSENNIIIPFQYDKLRPFKEEKAYFSLEGKQGYIDKSGEVIFEIDQAYHNFVDFSEGLAVFKINKKFGYIDEFGFQIIPPLFQDAIPFKNGVAIVSLEGKQFLINKKGQKIENTEHLNIWTEQTGLFRFAD